MSAGLRLYLASPLGFAESTRHYLDCVREHLTKLGFLVYDPWISSENLKAVRNMSHAEDVRDSGRRIALLSEANKVIGENNERAIRDSDVVLAILDGVDVDSGTASEIGFAAAIDLPVFGLRTDIRRTGENEASIVNPQVQWWIEHSGGTIATKLENVFDLLKRHAQAQM